MARPRKVTLHHVFIERRCVGLEAACQSLPCAPGRARILPITDLLKTPGITLATRLDEIEARLRCGDCGIRGEVELRPSVLCTPPASGSGVQTD